MVLPAGPHIVDEWLVEIAEKTEREWGIIALVATAGATGGGEGMGLANAPGVFDY